MTVNELVGWKEYMKEYKEAWKINWFKVIGEDLLIIVASLGLMIATSALTGNIIVSAVVGGTLLLSFTEDKPFHLKKYTSLERQIKTAMKKSNDAYWNMILKNFSGKNKMIVEECITEIMQKKDEK